MHGMTQSVLSDWKRTNGLITAEIEGVSTEIYRKLKKQGMTDRKIAKKFKTYSKILTAWKRQNFQESELKMLNKNRGRKNHKKSEKVDKG
ncbi:hypothetical protein J6TS1_37120 [Siminovitchia terrae]|uniref:Uncharacterized protein n=1 Tax=Siminovitchia terrae TaxID=1914933 RepID=A0ABQ4L1J6_SIMTE|nr:hypothetical protein [Siminovitchia terrae]GIN97842.1 hypothetical protein J6TS1_37120 [Siminovitchia terrae]